MRLILLRHAEAVPGHDLDPDRPLTKRGLYQAQAMGQQISEICSTARVVSSPWLRARETAAEIARALCVQPSSLDSLTPKGTPAMACSELEALWADGEGDVLIVVTHQPLCGCLISFLSEGVSTPLLISPCNGVLLKLDWPAAAMAQQLRWLAPNPV